MGQTDQSPSRTSFLFFKLQVFFLTHEDEQKRRIRTMSARASVSPCVAERKENVGEKMSQRWKSNWEARQKVMRFVISSAHPGAGVILCNCQSSPWRRFKSEMDGKLWRISNMTPASNTHLRRLWMGATHLMSGLIMVPRLNNALSVVRCLSYGILADLAHFTEK